MELFQVFWDDHRNLNLEFRASEEDQDRILPENVQRLNLKYEISKCDSSNRNLDEIPSLVSIKDFKIRKHTILFSLDFHQLKDPENLQIDFLQLKILLNSGKSIYYSIEKSYELSEIGFESFISDDYYHIHEENNNASITQEQLYAQTEIDYKNKTENKTVIYQKNQAKRSSNNSEIVELLKENNQRLSTLEAGIKELTTTLKAFQNMSLNTPNTLQPLSPPPGPPLNLKRPGVSNTEPIVRIRKSPPVNISQPASSKLLFIGELKSLIQSNTKEDKDFDFRSILKPMSDEDLNKITLNEEELNKRELEFFTKLIIKEEAK